MWVDRLNVGVQFDNEKQGEVMLTAKFNKNETRLNISVPVEGPRPSASGKSELVATSGGVVRTDAIIDGRRVHVICNAFVYPTDSRPKKRAARARASGDGDGGEE